MYAFDPVVIFWMANGVLLFSSLIFLIFFVMRKSEKSFLYLSLLTFSLFLRFLAIIYLGAVALDSYYYLSLYLLHVSILLFLGTITGVRRIFHVGIVLAVMEVVLFFAANRTTFYVANYSSLAVLLIISWGIVKLVLKKEVIAILQGLSLLPIVATGMIDLAYGFRGYLSGYILPGSFLMVVLSEIVIIVKYNIGYRKAEILSEYLSRLNRAYFRFVPKEVLNLINKKEWEDVHLGDGIKSNMTIMFVDVRNFTALTEGMDEAGVFNYLNDLFERISPEVRMNNGLINKYLGDGFLAIFPGKPLDAITCARSIQRKVSEFNSEHQSTIRLGIGIHTGSTIVGTVGETERMEATVISDAVNIASRVEGLTKDFVKDTIITSDVFTKLDTNEQTGWASLGEHYVKGKQKKVMVYCMKSD